LEKAKPIALVAVILLVVTAVLWGLTRVSNKPSAGTKPTSKLMRVGGYYWPGQYWVDIAQAKGWFKEAGLTVEVIDASADYAGSLQQVVEGTLDTQNFWLFDLMMQKSKGNDLVMVMNADTSIGAESIIANADINSIKDLKGKKIGIEKETGAEYALYTVLKQNGLDLKDVERVSDTTELLPNYLKEGEIDALIAWEPYTTTALEAKGAHKIWDTSQIPGLISAGYVFRESFVKERAADVQAFTEVWRKTTDYIKQNPDDSYRIIAERYNDTPENVKSYTAVNKVLNYEENLRAFSYESGFSSLHGQAKLINRYLKSQNIIADDIESEAVLNSSFINGLK
jgi:NitT/TauT family transport system substrate-binding protein